MASSVNVVLVGLGRFGRHYATELVNICEKRPEINFDFIICKTHRSGRIFQGVPVLVREEVEIKRLDSVDLFVIATPAHTHSEIIRSLPANSFKLVEKPLIDNRDWFALSVDKSKIRCAQIYRNHPITERLIDEMRQDEVAEINSIFHHEKKIDDKNEALELNHLLDLSYYIAGVAPKNIAYFSSNANEKVFVDRVEGSLIRAVIKTQSLRETRSLEVKMKNGKRFELDYLNETFTTVVAGISNKDYAPKIRSLIAIEISKALDLLLYSPDGYSNVRMPENLISQILTSTSHRVDSPRIAIIGGGIFGCEAARVLSQFGDVTLFERGSRLLEGATQNNQWRHHKGFHYPISYDTQKEIAEAVEEFERYYGGAIINIPSYYCVSATGSEIGADRLIASYDSADLNYQVVDPPAFVKHGCVSKCVLTDEGIYDIPSMRAICLRYLDKGNVDIRTSAVVEKVDVKSNFNFDISFTYEGESYTSNFNYVVNSAGVNWSKIAHSLSGSVHMVYCELTELMQVKSSLPKMCATFIDAPFCSIMSSGQDQYFQCTQRYQSLRREGLSETHKFTDTSVNLAPNVSILNNIAKYVSLPEGTEVLGSIFSTKHFFKNSQSIWDRSTELVNHHNGSVSILGGKILSSSRFATEISNIWGLSDGG